MVKDLSKKGEIDIINNFYLPQVDILKFGHHGSKTSTDEMFVKQLRPKIGIVSAGINNRYGHPNKETMMTAKNHHLKVYSTAKQGMIKAKWGLLNCYQIYYRHKLKH